MSYFSRNCIFVLFFIMPWCLAEDTIKPISKQPVHTECEDMCALCWRKKLTKKDEKRLIEIDKQLKTTYYKTSKHDYTSYQLYHTVWHKIITPGITSITTIWVIGADVDQNLIDMLCEANQIFEIRQSVCFMNCYFPDNLDLKHFKKIFNEGVIGFFGEHLEDDFRTLAECEPESIIIELSSLRPLSPLEIRNFARFSNSKIKNINTHIVLDDKLFDALVQFKNIEWVNFEKISISQKKKNIFKEFKKNVPVRIFPDDKQK